MTTRYRREHWWQEREKAFARTFPNPQSIHPYKKLWDWEAETGDRYGGRYIHRTHAYGGRNNTVDTWSHQRYVRRINRRRTYG